MKILEPTAENISAAAEVIRKGGVVVMPTETVYGLACDAMNSDAVDRVFSIKGRPSDNPLIVHLAAPIDLTRVAINIPDYAHALAKRFWPGPFTMVLSKRPEVPYTTTAGLDTVAVRVPGHEVALALIRESGCPLAAPSANPFTRISPTRADNIEPSLLEQVAMVINGGPCDIGLESTVLDLTSESPQLLRPGAISRADIESVLGIRLGHMPSTAVRKSPGLYRRHYAPRARVRLVERLRVGEPGMTFHEPNGQNQIKMPRDPRAYAATLYVALKKLDDLALDEIGIELPPQSSEWEAIHDRLKKASAS